MTGDDLTHFSTGGVEEKVTKIPIDLVRETKKNVEKENQINFLSKVKVVRVR